MSYFFFGLGMYLLGLFVLAIRFNMVYFRENKKFFQRGVLTADPVSNTRIAVLWTGIVLWPLSAIMINLAFLIHAPVVIADWLIEKMQ